MQSKIGTAIGSTWTTAVAGSVITLTFIDVNGRTFQLVMTTAEGALLGTALGGSGGVAVAGSGP
jgi:hypothetical protein